MNATISISKQIEQMVNEAAIKAYAEGQAKALEQALSLSQYETNDLVYELKSRLTQRGEFIRIEFNGASMGSTTCRRNLRTREEIKKALGETGISR